MELMAFLISVRGLKLVLEELGIEDTKRIIWTDSQCILISKGSTAENFHFGRMVQNDWNKTQLTGQPGTYKRLTKKQSNRLNQRRLEQVFSTK